MNEIIIKSISMILNVNLIYPLSFLPLDQNSQSGVTAVNWVQSSANIAKKLVLGLKFTMIS